MIECCKLFLLFIIYSSVGWCMEVITMFVQKRKFVNCGALIGPYCPIYGIAALLIMLLLEGFESNPLLLFSSSMVICSIVEYFTSYLIEKCLNIKWWDYSHIKFNLNGRICLRISLIFGILGVIFTYFLNPIIYQMLNSIHPYLIILVTTITMIIFVIDVFTSYCLMYKLKTSDNMKLDTYTNTITRLIKQKKKSF